MNAIISLGSFLALGLVGVWLERRRGARIERGIRAALAIASAEIRIRERGPDEGQLVALLERMGPDEQELQALGFASLGDLAFESATEGVLSVSRALVDASGTSLAYLSISPGPLMRPDLNYESYTSDDVFATFRRKSSADVAQPPFAHHQQVSPKLTCAEVVARHRAFAPLHDPRRSFLRITRLDELVQTLTRFEKARVTWRAAQPPDVLLESDLRCIFGRNYERHGEVWLVRLMGKVPQARARRARKP